MAKLNISEEEYLQMDPDDVDALQVLYREEKKMKWEMWMEIFKKLFGDK